MPIASTLTAAIQADARHIARLQKALSQAIRDMTAAQEVHVAAYGGLTHKLEVGKFAIIGAKLRKRQAAVDTLETELADRMRALDFAEALRPA
jgi:hypothetical protein